MVDRLGGARGRAAADAFKASLKRAQALIDIADFGADCARICGSMKHGCAARSSLRLIDAFEPGVDLTLGLVLGHAIALLKPAAEL